MSGTVVRWFTSVEAAERSRAFLSASRYEVVTHIEGIVTPELRTQANAVQDALQGEGQTQEWVRSLATHRRRFITGPMEPVSGGSTPEPDSATGTSAPSPLEGP